MRNNHYRSVISSFEGLSNIDLKVTMKSGAILNMGEFTVTDEYLINKQGIKASLLDVDYIEINSK